MVHCPKTESHQSLFWVFADLCWGGQVTLSLRILLMSRHFTRHQIRHLAINFNLLPLLSSDIDSYLIATLLDETDSCWIPLTCLKQQNHWSLFSLRFGIVKISQLCFWSQILLNYAWVLEMNTYWWQDDNGCREMINDQDTTNLFTALFKYTNSQSASKCPKVTIWIRFKQKATIYTGISHHVEISVFAGTLFTCACSCLFENNVSRISFIACPDNNKINTF